MAEPECAEQLAAKELLGKMRSEMALLREAQAQGRAPPASDPMEAALEAEFERRMAQLELEAARPASKRLPADAAPPRDVLSVLGAGVFLAEPPRGAHATSIVSRCIGKDDGRVVLGVSVHVSLTNGWPGGPDERLAPNTNLAMLPWRAEMGTWAPVKWAWLLALLYRKSGVRCELRSVRLSFKLQDRPTPEFRQEVQGAFADVCRTRRLEAERELYKEATFAIGPVDLDMQNDLAYQFDTVMWRVAVDLGFEVEDRSHAPAFVYHIGADDCPVDCTRKRWANAETYVRARLGAAKRSADLSEADAAKHIEFIWELLASQTLAVDENGSTADLWGAYAEFAERKLGKALRRVARKYNQPTPAAASAQTKRRCDACGAAEGEALDAAGGVGAKLRSCACNPGGVPFYCNQTCQKAGWPAHREFCTAAPAAKSKAKGGK